MDLEELEKIQHSFCYLHIRNRNLTPGKLFSTENSNSKENWYRYNKIVGADMFRVCLPKLDAQADVYPEPIALVACGELTSPYSLAGLTFTIRPLGDASP